MSDASAEELMGRLFGSLIGTMELATIYLGARLGLYAALAEPRSAAELAQLTGVDTRYAEEWLEQQAIAGLLTVDTPGSRAERRYVCDEAQRAVLTDEESPLYAVPLSLMLGGLAGTLPQLVEAFGSGAGISFGGYGDDVRLGQGLFNRGSFLGQLTQEWVPALDGVEELLRRPGASALDVGCGVGWSSLALAEAYPGLHVLGVDSDDASIMDARAHASAADGVGDRVRFEVADAAGELGGAAYDVAFYFECLHDLGHPIESLAAVREVLNPGGRVVVMDEAAEEEFAPNGSEVERALATFSVLHCLPVGRSEPDSAATGALMRPGVLRSYAERAGYSGVDVAPIEHEMFRFYVLTP